MLVRILMDDSDREIVVASADTTIPDAMDLMITNNIGCLPIVDDKSLLIGIVSDKDIFKRIHETKGQYRDLNMKDLMTTEVIVGVPEDELTYIAGVMQKNWIRHVPIVAGGKIVGLISQRDIVKAQTENVKIENRYLKLYSSGLGLRDKSSDF